MTRTRHGRTSWLRLAGVGLATLPAVAQTGGDAAPVCGDAVQALLRDLDQHFARGDVAGYLQRFLPDHPGAHALLQRQLEQCAGPGSTRRRTSVVVGEPRVIGPRTVVRVRHEVELLRSGHGQPQPGATFTEDRLLVLRREPDGSATPTMSVEVAIGPGVPADRFRCDPCNFELGGVPDWLCVPLRPERAGALEGATFYLLGTDVACDVSVRIGAGDRSALQVTQELVDTLRGVEADARLALPAPWQPPSLGADAPDGLDGAMAAIDLPADFAGGGGRAILYVVTFGGLQHLLLLRGSAAALQRHHAPVDALLASYRPLERDCDLALAAARPLQHHTGDTLDGSVYHNTRHGVQLTGPAGWTPSLRSGGAAFRVAWCSRDGGRLWLTGHTVPPGMVRWCPATADRWLEHLCHRHGLALEPGSDGWHRLGDGGRSRSATAVPATPGGPRRRIRVLLYDDLLVIADGHAGTPSADEALQRALASLQRR